MFGPRSALTSVLFFFETKKVFCSTAWFLARKRMLKKCSALISALLEGPIPGQVGGGRCPSLASKEGSCRAKMYSF